MPPASVQEVMDTIYSMELLYFAWIF